MNRIEFRDLISIEEAKNRLSKYFVSKEEIRDISKCQDQVLAEDIYSDVDVPGFDRAAMDGYAVKAKDTFGAEEDEPISLDVVGKMMPGEVKDLKVSDNEAIEVATGAVMPEGANAVVMVEFVNEEEDTALVRKAVSPNENVMYAGSDILAGEKVLSRGNKLNPRDIGVLGAIGQESVLVNSCLDIGVISIGEELVSPGEDAGLGEIFDTNSFSLRSAIEEVGCEPKFYGVIGDDLEKIKKVVEKALDECDVVLTSGSTSAGSSDLMHSVLEDGEILFHGVSIKPGKPTIAAELNNSLLIGLPGYPTSALTIYNLLVDPLLRESLGKKVTRKEVKAKTATKIRSTSGRRHYHPVGLVKKEEGYLCYPIEKGSGAITSLAQAEGFLEVKKDENYVPEDSSRRVNLFSEEIELPDLLFIGSHSIGIDLIRKELSCSSKSLNVGSSGGFRYINKGVSDIAGVHLLSQENEYNVPFFEKYDLDDKAILIRGYLRKQGFLVKKNNPLNVSKISDLIDKDLRLINRNEGSGTRKLLEIKLDELANKRGLAKEEISNQIKGYSTSSKTHSGVASSIKLDKADIGVGAKYFAEKNNLDFIELREENYDFLINKKSLYKQYIDDFLNKLRSNDFRNKLNKITGIRAHKDTGKVIKD